jgi:dihydrodipicolinate reductase
MKRSLIIFTLLICCVVGTYGQSTNSKVEKQISGLMTELTDAALKNNVSVAQKLYAENMIVTSQSGKVYSKKDSLLDLKNPFKKYENSEILFVHINKKVVVVNYINTRKRKTLEEVKYRVTAVWAKKKSWQIVSMQSTKIATQGM